MRVRNAGNLDHHAVARVPAAAPVEAGHSLAATARTAYLSAVRLATRTPASRTVAHTSQLYTGGWRGWWAAHRTSRSYSCVR